MWGIPVDESVSQVHLRTTLLRPYLASTMARLPDSAAALVRAALRDVYAALGW